MKLSFGNCFTNSAASFSVGLNLRLSIRNVGTPIRAASQLSASLSKFEITLIPQKQIEEISTELDISTFESVDQIVSKEIEAIESEQFNKKMLLDIYNEL